MMSAEAQAATASQSAERSFLNERRGRCFADLTRMYRADDSFKRFLDQLFL